MVRLRGTVPVLIFAALMAYPVLAQDTNRFPVGVAGQGKRCYFGECEDGAPPQATAPVVPREDGGAPKAAAPPEIPTPTPTPSHQASPVHRPAPHHRTTEAAPARPAPSLSPDQTATGSAAVRTAPSPSPLHQNALNFADELTNFGVPPQNVLQTRLGSRTPTSVPGARVVTTLQLRRALQSGLRFLLVDAWDDMSHEMIPRAVHIPYAGRPGTFYDDVQKIFFLQLGRFTQFNPAYPIVFYCAGSDCWESYNATLRAEAMGYSNVFWYRGGMAAWREGTIALR